MSDLPTPASPDDKAVRDFMRVYEKAYGPPISEDDAREVSTRLLTLYNLFLLRPLEKPSETRNPARRRYVHKVQASDIVCEEAKAE